MNFGSGAWGGPSRSSDAFRGFNAGSTFDAAGKDATVIPSERVR
ncbi:MAG TPA: hypothetical protein VKC60_16090 [Opitutaceae bacterium]|nr:hypothetical protein [Opitutaceae bacterium]